MVDKRSRKPRPGNGDGSIPSPSANSKARSAPLPTTVSKQAPNGTRKVLALSRCYGNGVGYTVTIAHRGGISLS
jgi:hypothetical protein